MTKYYDTSSVINVLSNIYTNPSILEDERYHFNGDDFDNKFHKMIFGTIYNLYMLGAQEINLQIVEDYINSKPQTQALYKANKGTEYLQQLESIGQSSTFDYYYNRMKKFTLLRAYQKVGLDMSSLYDEDNITNLKKKEKQEQWLDNTTIEDIAQHIDDLIDDIKLRYVDNSDFSSLEAGAGIFQLIEDLQKKPAYGYPMYGKYINTITMGARRGEVYMRSAQTGLGKAIPNDTLIPTPRGFKQVKDIQVGDYIFGQNGKPTKVLARYPQPTKKDIWKITFIDGREALCCGEHLWEYRRRGHDKFVNVVENTEEIYNRAMKTKTGFRGPGNRSYRFSIKINEPVEYSTKKYSVSPYAMGLILGDGSLRYGNTNKALTFSSADEELPARLAAELGENIIYKKKSDFNYDYTFKQANSKHNLWIDEILKDYPELWNTKSEDKSIPKEYLLGDIEQRFALLQGLMDTDGHIDTAEKGRTSFTTISPQLRDDIIELCRSLGMVATYLVDKRREKYTTGECYIIHIQAKKELKPKMFSLSRKVKIAMAYANNGKHSYEKNYLSIVNIEKLNQSTEMTCFTVDAEDHLFLMNDYITTHNTRTMIADACNFACNELYNPFTEKWEDNGTKEPTLYITTEQTLKEMQTMFLSFIAGVDEGHIKTGKYLEGELDRVKHAAKILSQSPLYVQELPDFGLTDVENCIKKEIRVHNVGYVCHDYIHTSIKLLSEIGSRSGAKGLREDNFLFLLGVKLKDIAVQYDIFILTATQLNGQISDAETLDQNCLRGSKSLGDKISLGEIMVYANQADREKIAPIARRLGVEMPTIKMSVYKNRGNRYNNILVWCVDHRDTCRIDPVFITRQDYELIEDIPDIQINITSNNSASAF